jgi:hypothetical protein
VAIVDRFGFLSDQTRHRFNNVIANAHDNRIDRDAGVDLGVDQSTRNRVDLGANTNGTALGDAQVFHIVVALQAYRWQRIQSGLVFLEFHRPIVVGSIDDAV